MTVTYAWTTRDVVTVAGTDAATYLQGQLSQDVLALSVGAAAPTFVLAPQGKVEGWGRIRRTGEHAFAIDTDPGAGEAWEARLRRFLLRTAAEITVAAGVPTLAVRGAVVDGAPAAVGPGVVGSDLIGVEGPDLPPTVPAGATEVPSADLDAVRIRAGVPAWGAEIDADTIPATLGQWVIDASVSFTKGCYTGQELVARIDSRGGNVPRRLLVATVEGGAVVAPGTEVEVDGTAVGTVTSSAPGVALAFVARSVEVPADGTDATAAGTSLHLTPS